MSVGCIKVRYKLVDDVTFSSFAFKFRLIVEPKFVFKLGSVHSLTLVACFLDLIHIL